VNQLTIKRVNNKLDEWDFFAISHEANSNADTQEKQIRVEEEIEDWVVQLVWPLHDLVDYS
jgi:hypothetical protein